MNTQYFNIETNDELNLTCFTDSMFELGIENYNLVIDCLAVIPNYDL